LTAFDGQLVNSRDGHSLLRLDGYPVAGGETKVSSNRQSSVNTDVELEILSDCLEEVAADIGLFI